MTDASPRLFVTLIGDVDQEPFARVKYGCLLESLRRAFPIEIRDATLRGLPRLFNALQVFSPDRRLWKERFYQNVPAFELRSASVARALRGQAGRVDLIFQIGVLYDASRGNTGIPAVIYTDYTSVLSGRRPELGRSPLTPEERKRWIRLEQAAFQRAAHICTRSEFVRASVIADYGIPPERVTAVGGGVNMTSLPALSSRAGTASPTVLFIGKDFYRKGGDILLRAFANVQMQLPGARLVMLTNGPLPAGLDLRGVEVIPPTWDRTFIHSLYQSADCFVLPSRLETWGDVLLEAMAFGLPCIGVSGEGMGEIITDPQNGLLVPPEDATALAGALVRLLSDANLRARMGGAARQRIESQFTWDHVVARIYPILMNAIQSSIVLKGRDA
ncbi:glycosyltransferase [Longilinea arvoryzae]|uniref:Glycosyltransferase n=1 Tax=Longilinea arvoryzae TaxID=360412 RepID=A0A0S7BIT5_9CHLR|nr:glycosyltransferase family 4 protein [Longilinea arvoryzae]GAP14499.1 glycosyltransferase [Longilinea arvoryzae]